ETDVPLLEHVWYIPGMYQVRMEVEDEDGSTARVIVTVIVTDVVPVADAGGPYEVDEGEELAFDASGSFEPGDHIVDYAWDMNGDGLFDVRGADATAAWSWTIAGTHEVSLTVTDAEGNMDETSAAVTVLDLPPTFSFVLPDSVEEGVTYYFAIEDLADPGTVTFQVVWYFGDGASAEGHNVTHAFDEDGTYEGSITILDNDGTRHTFIFPSIIVANAPPRIILDSDLIRVTEDEPFEYQVQAQDTYMDTMTYEVQGPGGEIDPDTGIFSWTPQDEDVGKHIFTFIVTDEDGGRSEVTVTLDVEDVDNDFIAGMSTAGGSALILAIILAVIIVAVLYMKTRGGKGSADDDESPGEGTVVDVPSTTVPKAAPVIAPVETPAATPAAAPAAAPAGIQAPPPLEPVAPMEIPPLPDGNSTSEDASAASSEAVSGAADQIPPPPPPPVGPEFNKVLEDKASESEIKTEEETEPDHASEWEILE
ncbi:MAG: PKD domain-containing protein, partial [Candidatus Thermoplasmatota archaeon]|nr:PKD domain-containing protein [Candidatus Thermoplasmatota archaeon]